MTYTLTESPKDVDTRWLKVISTVAKEQLGLAE